MIGKRSEIGLGSICGIYVLGPAEKFGDSIVRAHGDTAMSGSRGEDYAITTWPVVVKAKAEVTAQQLSQYLRDLAGAIDRGFFMPIDPDRDTLPSAIIMIPE